jgi:predicted regulator of Ras-like GTPase activity (Roadblock/LC7/MglB family)
MTARPPSPARNIAQRTEEKTAMTSLTHHDKPDLAWLLDAFITDTPGAEAGIVVSADGLLMVMSRGLDRTRGDQLAAVVAGLASLTRGAARHWDMGQVRQTIIEFEAGFIMLMNISDGSVMAVATDGNCDVGLVGYEMALLVSRAEAILTPQLVAEMRGRLSTAGPQRSVNQ